MTRPMALLPTLAVASLVLVGLFVIAIFSPPLFNMIFGEEYAWDAWGVAYGVAHLAAAVVLATLRSRLGLGACLILAMIGFTTLTAFLLERVSSLVKMMQRPETFIRVEPIELLTASTIVFLNALIIVGVFDAARRWNMLPAIDAGRAMPAAILGGIGFAIGLASWGGDYAILVSPTAMPIYETIPGWFALGHFVAVAALAFGGRFAVPLAVAVSLGGAFLGVSNVATLATRDLVTWSYADSIVLWVVLTAGYLTAAANLLRPPAAIRLPSRR